MDAKGALPPAGDESRCPRITLRWEPSLPCLQAPTPASAPSLALGGPLALHCVAVLPGEERQCGVASHDPPLCCGLRPESAKSGRCGQVWGCGQEPAASLQQLGWAACLGEGEVRHRQEAGAGGTP